MTVKPISWLTSSVTSMTFNILLNRVKPHLRGAAKHRCVQFGVSTDKADHG